MHRAIEITAPSASTDVLIRDLARSDRLISLSVHRGASIKPSGDVLTRTPLSARFSCLPSRP
jgi:hypothetical protein